jgi:hypothetical protein
LDLDFTVFLDLFSPCWTVALGEAFFFEFLLISWRRAVSDGQRDWYVCRRPPFIPLHVAIARERAAIEGIKGRLSTDILGTSRSPGPLPVDLDLEVPPYNRLAAIRGECLVGDLGRCWFFEQIVAAAASEAVVFAEHLPLPLSHHDGRRRSTALVLLADVHVAATAGEAVMLVEVEVVLDVAGRRAAAAGHALEPVAVPSFAATGRVVVVVQRSGRGAIHGAVLWCAAWSVVSMSRAGWTDCGALVRYEGAVQRKKSSERADKVDETRQES